jgi:hypothetical protein
MPGVALLHSDRPSRRLALHTYQPLGLIATPTVVSQGADPRAQVDHGLGAVALVSKGLSEAAGREERAGLADVVVGIGTPVFEDELAIGEREVVLFEPLAGDPVLLLLGFR